MVIGGQTNLMQVNLDKYIDLAKNLYYHCISI
ncbi:hypothetical protein Salpa_4393 [Sporomusa sp. KB1]|jgi:hypothetical protein|nr:hypothetical protein Salpa_4393 [Sporomusa sp. KB1]